jgi:hypothetical protein
MSFINQFSRICFENCIVKDHFGSNGTAEFRKKTTFKGPVCVNGTLQLSTKEITIRVPKDFPTIQEALDSFAGRHAGCVKLLISKGEYKETLSLEKFSSSIGSESRNPDDPVEPDKFLKTISKGLMIIGDSRRHLCRTYANGVRFAGNSGKTREVQLETNISGVGPFRAVLASDFGVFVNTETSLAQLQVADPVLGSPSPLAPFGGNAALMDRGSFAFVTKCTNAENAGASLALVANNDTVNPDDPVSMGGGPAPVGIPCAGVSYNTGQALRSALVANPGLQVKIVNSAGYYNIPLGSNYAMVNLSSPSPNKIQVVMSDLPLNDVNLLDTPQLADPDFDNPLVGYRVGDQVHVSSSSLSDFSDVVEVRTIVGFESSSEGGPNNVLVLDSDLSVDVTKKGAHFAVMPCVRILGKNPKVEYTCTVNGCDVAMHGLWFDDNTDLPPIAGLEGSMYCVNSTISLGNCAMTDSNSFLGNGYQLVLVGSTCLIYDGYRGSGNTAVYISGANALNINDGSWMGGGFLTVANSAGNGVLVNARSHLNVSNLQILGNNFLYLSGNAGLYVSEGSSADVANLLSVVNCWGSGIRVDHNSQLVCGESAVQVECNYLPAGDFADAAAITISGDSRVTILDGIAVESSGSADNLTKITSGPKIINNSNGDNFFGYANPNVGILLKDCSKFYSLAALDLSGTDVPYRVLQNGELTIAAQNNRIVHTVSGPLDHAYHLQAIDSGGPSLNLTLDPSEKYLGDSLHVGKTYCLYDCSGGGHHLNLSGAAFWGCGFEGESIAQFGGTLGDSLLFYVQDENIVIVKNACGVSPYDP